MNWLNNMILDLTKRLSTGGNSDALEETGLNQITEKKSVERLHKFQSRLQDLDRRLLELR